MDSNILGFGRCRNKAAAPPGDGGAETPAGAGGALAALLDGVSIEVMPRTAAKVADFAALLPRGTRVYVAHIDGTPIEDMIATAARLRAEGMEPMPHLPARSIPDRDTLARWIDGYRARADVHEALVLGGGIARPCGSFDCALDLLRTGLLDGFRRLHIAGHPEGNRDIDPAGGDANARAALLAKQAHIRAHTDAGAAIVTQFAFDPDPIAAWGLGLADAGVTLPVHVGLAGPAKLQTLIRYAVSCGVGASLRVLERRARDVSRLLVPFEPTELALRLAASPAAAPGGPIRGLHLFPLGGIAPAASWAATHRAGPGQGATMASG